jgi:hypothetical protein
VLAEFLCQEIFTNKYLYKYSLLLLEATTMLKSLSRVFLLVFLICSAVLVGTIPFSKAQASMSVIGEINSNTTWTKANSPYALIGQLTVKNGSSLTIEPGVTVYLNNYQLFVEGNLIARGTKTDFITFNGGQISFSQTSDSWNEQNSSGSIIENATVTSSLGISGSPKITGNAIQSVYIDGGSSEISNNNIGHIEIHWASPTICSNNITAGIQISGGNSQIHANILNNNITSIDYGVVSTGYAIISGNLVSGCQSGFYLTTSADGQSASPLIERNTISNNDRGIDINIHLRDNEVGSFKILNNTISKNRIGIYLVDQNVGQDAISYNNIQNNSIWNVYLVTSPTTNEVNLSPNWWGGTDAQSINHTICYNEVTGGRVTLTPLLTVANPQAVPDLNALCIFPASSSIPATSPTVPEMSSVITTSVILSIIALMFVLTIALKKTT